MVVRAFVTAPAIQKHAEYWIARTGGGRANGVHVPAPGSTREETETLCINGNRARSHRVLEHEMLPDTHLEGRMCSVCVREMMKDGRIELPDGVPFSAIDNVEIVVELPEEGRR